MATTLHAILSGCINLKADAWEASHVILRVSAERCRQQDIANSNADLAIVQAQTGQRQTLAQIEAQNAANCKQVYL